MKKTNIFKNSSRLGWRIVLYVVLASIFITIFISAFQLHDDYKSELSVIESRHKEIQDSLLDVIALHLWVSNQSELDKTLEGILRLPDIDYITVYEGNVLVSVLGKKPIGDSIVKDFPLFYTFRSEKRKIGSIQISTSLEAIYQKVFKQAVEIIISNGIQIFLISGFMLFLFYSLVARHLNKIAMYAENLNMNSLGQRLLLDRKENNEKNKDEFDLLINAIHAMQFNLKRSIHNLAESEENLSQTLDCIGDAVIVTNTLGHINRMNPIAEELTGWSFSEAINKPLAEVYPIFNGITKEPVGNLVKRVLETGKIVGLDKNTVLTAKNGAEYQISESAAPIFGENMEIHGVIIVFHNVTEEYELQEAIRKNEERLQSIMDYSSSVIYVKDLEGRFTSVNRQFERLVDLKEKQIVGKTTHDLFPKEIADEMVANDNDVLNSHLALHSDEKVLQNDGLHTYSSDKFCLFDDDGVPYAVAGISTDVTEKLVQLELLRRSQKMDALGKLTGGIAHDFNNMLNVIIGYADILKRNLDVDSSNTHFVEEIKNAGQRGVTLTRKLLSFSGQSGTEKFLVNINNLLEDDLDMLKKTLTARINISLKLDKQLWLTTVDKSELEDVVLNLSINAMHAMPTGGNVTYFTLNESLGGLEANKIGLPVAGDYVRLSIIDSGTGMPESITQKIFDPFFTTKGEQGTGLGLSQVYGFMERCEGAVTVTSTVGRGTEFSLYFPRKTGKVDVKNSEAEVDSDGEELRGTETILLVDDEVALLQLAQNILKQQGYKVYCAEGADNALWILSRNKVDIMISDIIMPGTSGVELAKKVEDLYPDIKIQLVSGYAGTDTEEDKNNRYIKELINKPYDADTLLQRVRNQLDS